MVAEESFEKQEEEEGGSTSTLFVSGVSSPLSTVNDIYRQLSSKGILSYYGRRESETNEPFDAYHHLQQLQQPPGSPLPPPPHPSPPPPSSFSLEKATDPRPTPVKISVALEDGQGSSSSSSSSLKPRVLRAPSDLRLLAAVEVLRSACRNAGCFVFLASVVYLAVEGDEFLPSLSSRLHRSLDGRLAAVVLLCLGAVAIPFQVVHALSEVKDRRGGGREGGGGGRRRTLVAQMLLSPVTRAKLDERLAELRESAPYVGVEMRLRRPWISALCCCCCCCQRRTDETQRKLNSVLRYDSWTDVSPPSTTTTTAYGGSRWVIVCKDYRWSGTTTEAWIQEELNRFKDSVDLGRGRRWGRRRASVEFVLDLQEGMSFPDAEALLVHPSALGESRFYSFRVYVVCLCLCLDSVYNALFHVLTKRIPDQRIVKIIRRNVNHHSN